MLVFSLRPFNQDKGSTVSSADFRSPVFFQPSPLSPSRNQPAIAINDDYLSYENLGTAVLYDPSVALHLGSEDVVPETGPEKGVYETAARFTRVTEAMSRVGSPNLEPINLKPITWKSTDPTHEAACIEMCKLAHISKYVDGMFQKLTEKEQKEGPDSLSVASFE